MRYGTRHSAKHAARVGSKQSFVHNILCFVSLLLLIPLQYIHHAVLYAYSYITPPCFYSPGNAFHHSLRELIEGEEEAIILCLEHKQRKIIKLHQEKRHKFLLIIIMLLLMLFKHHTVAHAGSSTSSFNVSASVAAKCAVVSSGMAFGTYDPTVTSDLNVNGFIQLNCTKNTTVSIALDNGSYASNAIGTTRAMFNQFANSGQSAYMSYELYKNSSRTSIWSTSSPLSYTSTSSPANIPIYGKIPQQQNVQGGGFIDTVIITVNF